MDAFPDYTKFDYNKKVLSVIQIIDEESPIVDKEAEAVQPTALYIAGDNKLIKGDKAKWVVAIEPINADSRVTWNVESDNDCISITADGIVTAKESGTATVIATSVANPTIRSNEIEVTVIEQA
jgi:hypothetical protein